MPSSALHRTRGKPLIEAVNHRHLRGPNLHADHSVLVVTLRGDEPLAQLAQAAPAGLGALAGCEALVGGAELVELVETAHANLPDGADGWALGLAAAAAALADYTLVPAPGRVLVRGASEVEVMVPADVTAIGMAALDLGLAIALGAMGRKATRALHEKVVASRKRFAGIARKHSLDMLTLAVARKAIEHDIPVYLPAPTQAMVQLGQGRLGRVATETVLDPQSPHANRLARDKWTTLNRLLAFGLPVLPSGVAANADQAVELARQIAAPVAIKPASGSKGIGISLNLTTPEQVRNAYAIAARGLGHVLVERYAKGHDHRLLVVNGKMIAAARRVPATVTGDGKHTVRELIETLNADPRRGLPYEKLMEVVRVDQRLDVLLSQQRLTLASIPADGVVVRVSLAANISQGGTAIDFTDAVHPDNRAAAEIAARACRALVAGVDFLTPDISRSWREGNCWILEVNTSPGLRPHWIANPAQDVTTPVLRVAFPEGARSRIPTVGITGSMGKSTTCQMLAQIARSAGRHPALSTTQGTWSGSQPLKGGDWAGGTAAADLMTDPLVDISIAELSRGGLLKRGMILDAVDVAAVLNVRDNHVGIDGIADREALARIKAIPVRRAREWVFLDADDPLVLGMREQMQPGVRLALVSPNPKSAALAAHRAAGGCTVALEGTKAKRRVVVRDGEKVALELPLSSIPASSHVPGPAIATNAMFAAGIALKLGFSASEVATGLAQFTSDAEQNPGRHNRIEGLPFDLMLTWADGVEALRELIELRSQETAPGARHLNMIVPGNRSDAWVREMGRAAAGGFDRYWCSDMADLRGRSPGEVPALMADGLRAGGVSKKAITCLAGGDDSLRAMLARIEPKAQVTVIALETAAALRAIEAFRRDLAGG